MNSSDHSNETTSLKAERYLPDVVAKSTPEARQPPGVYVHCPPPQLQSYLLHLAALSGSQPIRDVIEHQNRAIDYSIGGDNASSWSITEQQRRRVTSSSPPSGNSINSASPAGSSIHHHNLISALPAVSFLPSLLGDILSKSSSAIFPYPVARAAAAAAAALHHASASATHHRHHYQPASVDHLKRCFSGSDGSSSTLLPTTTADSFHRQLQAVAAAAAAAQRAAAAAVTAQHHIDEPKPTQSYIGLIAMAILNSTERKLVLSDIYQWILDHYPYFRHRGPGWRNSIRHNLSLNDCFVKAGRSANGKGHYWAVHPANVEDFERGDFRRRRAQRKVRRAMGLAVLPDDNDDDLDSPMPSPAAIDYFRSPPTLLRCSSGPTAIPASVSRFTTDSDRTTLAMWENDVTSPAVTDVHYSNVIKQGDATMYSGTWGAAHFDKRRYSSVSTGDDVSSLNRLQTTNIATTTKTLTSFRRRLFDIESILASNNEEIELTSRTDDCQQDSPSSMRADATLQLDHVVQSQGHDKDHLSTAPITGSEDGQIESEDGGDALSTITCSSCNWCSAHINNHCSGRDTKDSD